MEALLKRRAKAMATAIEAGMPPDLMQRFFEKCLEAHAIDTLKEVTKND
jgi:hypothetical protein